MWGELPPVRVLSDRPGLTGRTVTPDAIHVRQEMARRLTGQGTDHLLTAVRGSQPTITNELRAVASAGRPFMRPSKGAMAVAGAPRRHYR